MSEDSLRKLEWSDLVAMAKECHKPALNEISRRLVGMTECELSVHEKEPLIAPLVAAERSRHTERLDDADLIKRIQLGDQDAEARLVEIYDRFLESLFKGRLKGTSAIDQRVKDLKQETWLKVIRAFRNGRYVEQYAFRNWLATVAVHCLGDDNRQQSRNGAKHQALAPCEGRDAEVERPNDKEVDSRGHVEAPDEQIQDPNVPSPPDHAITRETGLLIREAIKQLPEDEGKVLTLLYLQQLTYGETARALGLNVREVEKRENKALERLRKALGDEQRRSAG